MPLELPTLASVGFSIHPNWQTAMENFEQGKEVSVVFFNEFSRFDMHIAFSKQGVHRFTVQLNAAQADARLAKIFGDMLFKNGLIQQTKATYYHGEEGTVENIRKLFGIAEEVSPLPEEQRAFVQRLFY